MYAGSVDQDFMATGAVNRDGFFFSFFFYSVPASDLRMQNGPGGISNAPAKAVKLDMITHARAYLPPKGFGGGVEVYVCEFTRARDADYCVFDFEF